MFYISEIMNTKPTVFITELQNLVYTTLEKLEIPFERVNTDEAISMDDCILINQKMNMKMVKTLFLCNRQQTDFYLFITTAHKSFKSKEFSKVLNISRVSFAPAELLQEKLGTKVGAATILSVLFDVKNEIQVVIDKEVILEDFYGCSDGTTTGYMKINTELIINNFLNYAMHKPIIIEIQ